MSFSRHCEGVSRSNPVLKARFHFSYLSLCKPLDDIQTSVYFDDLLDCVVAVAPRNDVVSMCIFMFKKKLSLKTVFIFCLD